MRGSIPARAGQPSRATRSTFRHRVHPRASGATSNWRLHSNTIVGPSPRERGNLPPFGEAFGAFWSIPARAGQPGSCPRRTCRRWVHPRASGATLREITQLERDGGPSPRERGNPREERVACLADGSIPARAGQPSKASATTSGPRVHPRASGATVIRDESTSGGVGPSPRERGNRSSPHDPATGRRSIPARAGQPRGRHRFPSSTGVHPRASGATVKPARAIGRRAGPSPRERGNRGADGPVGAGAGSIPARAGQPGHRRRQRAGSRVHPRASGATALAVLLWRRLGGPSPRERGNPDRLAHRPVLAGSIPARAGQPRSPTSRPSRPGVHPRASGATGEDIVHGLALKGPSPRERGNLQGQFEPVRFTGSIPARAGQPTSTRRKRAATRVHPRASGATAPSEVRRKSWLGPSPRERGNPRPQGLRDGSSGSIPARAGQPEVVLLTMRCLGVHPRASGATRITSRSDASRQGPSPRERGNREFLRTRTYRSGSIPARAGQPRQRRWSS